MPRFRVVLMPLALSLLPSTLWAQGAVQFSLSGFGGIFLPAADLVDGQFVDPDIGAIALNFGQATGFTAGGRVAIWPTARIGIEAEAAYVGSDVEGSFVIASNGGLVADRGKVSANLFVGSLSVVYALFRPALEPLIFYVSGGAGLVSRGGDFYELLDDTFDIAGVVGMGLKYGVAQGVWLRVDLKDYISSYKEAVFEEGFSEGGGSQLQNDLLVTAGVEIFVGGR